MKMINAKKIVILLGLTLSLGVLQSSTGPIELDWTYLVRSETCHRHLENDPIITSQDFRWNQPLDEVLEREAELYFSGKRLKNRAFVHDDQGVVIPFTTIRNEQRLITLTPRFILSVRRHIEEALRLGYVDSVTFSDMGHSHFFIPEQFYRDELASITTADRDVFYTKLLSHDDLKMLYHTAEQLKMFNSDRTLINDRHLQWRFYTRNLVGDNRGEGRLELVHEKAHSHNTARGYREGYRYWGAGFYINSSS